MKVLRQIHLYLGCFFTPLILYFALSGAWQVLRLNDLPKDQTPTLLRSIAHELSKPHTHSTAPGKNPRSDRSTAFDWISISMALGLIFTTFIGLILAFRFGRSFKFVVLCLILGLLLPVLMLI